MKRFLKFVFGAIIVTILACIVISFIFPQNLEKIIEIIK